MNNILAAMGKEWYTNESMSFSYELYVSSNEKSLLRCSYRVLAEFLYSLHSLL